MYIFSILDVLAMVIFMNVVNNQRTYAVKNGKILQKLKRKIICGFI